MEEDEKIDYRTHLISQLDSMIDSGVPIYDITLANKKAIKVNYRDKIQQLEKENKELKERECNHNIDNGCIRKSNIVDKLKENKERADCRFCDNTCGSYQLCEFCKELLEG